MYRERRLFPLVVLLALVIASGCDLCVDVDAIQLEPRDVGQDVARDGDVAADVPNLDAAKDASPDGDVTSDGGPEEVDVRDTGPDADERTCEQPFPVDPNTCNPARQTGCPAGAECTVVLVNLEPAISCRDPNVGSASAGETCTSSKQHCVPDLVCVNWPLGPDPRPQSCARFCELESGYGCEQDEFCTRAEAFPPFEGIGFCTPRCDPYAPTACGPGQTCSIDYNYPEGTCEPEFRCLETRSEAPAGVACEPDDPENLCAPGYVCYPTQGGTRCVQPCRDDGDCTESCGDPVGPWRLRYCR